MKAWLRAVVLVPVAVVMVSFALANRAFITLRLDPFDVIDPPPTFEMPLFLPIFVSLMVGILVGGTAMWLSQGRHRRAVRSHLRTIEMQRRQMDERAEVHANKHLPPAPFIG
jgi:uncharacterized integral membrane protein